MSDPVWGLMLCRKVCEAMYCENMPLYPGMRPPCDPSPCMRVRLFDDACGRVDACGRNEGCCRHAPPMRVCERVMIDNPCRAGERAEVVLGVDDCGNLVICVHRLCGCDRPCGSQRPCRPQRPCPDAECDPCVPWPEPRKPRRRHRPDWACCR